MTLYYLFLFLVPFQEHHILGANLIHLGSFQVTPIKVLGAVLLAAAAILPRPKDAAARPSGSVFILFIAFIVFPTVGTLLDSHPFPGADASALIAFALLMAATNELVSTPVRMRNAIRAIVLAETFGSTWLYRQYYIYHWWRPIGPSSDPNYEALALVLTVPLALWLAGHEKSRWWKRIGMVCVPVLAFGVFITQSRGGFLALAVTGGLIWLNSKRKLRRAVQLAAAAALLLVLGPGNLIHRLEEIRFTGSVESGAQLSTRVRFELDRAALHMVEAHPVFGIGLEQFKNQEIRYNPRLLIVDPVRHIAHDTYLELAAEGGLPTLALYMAIILMTLFTCRTIERDREVPEAFAALACSVRIGLIGFLVAGIFLSAEYVKEPWVLVCLTPNLYQISRQMAAGARRAGRSRSGSARSAVLPPRYRMG